VLDRLKELFFSSFSPVATTKQGAGMTLMTHDAHIIHQIETKADSSEAALISGLWQASSQLTKNKDSILDFAGSSAEGFYAGCLDEEGKYLVYTKYSNQKNPAHLKFLFKRAIHDFREGSLKLIPRANKVDFLFDEISDDEIDKMFQGLGV